MFQKKTHFTKVISTELSMPSKLPFTLDVCIIEFTWQLVGELKFCYFCGSVSQALGLGGTKRHDYLQ